MHGGAYIGGVYPAQRGARGSRSLFLVVVVTINCIVKVPSRAWLPLVLARWDQHSHRHVRGRRFRPIAKRGEEWVVWLVPGNEPWRAGTTRSAGRDVKSVCNRQCIRQRQTDKKSVVADSSVVGRSTAADPGAPGTAREPFPPSQDRFRLSRARGRHRSRRARYPRDRTPSSGREAWRPRTLRSR